jgi:hypothetical protein
VYSPTLSFLLGCLGVALPFPLCLSTRSPSLWSGAGSVLAGVVVTAALLSVGLLAGVCVSFASGMCVWKVFSFFFFLVATFLVGVFNLYY